MKEAFPNYYHKFSCIAERCQHSCCIGWEIDIDEDTYVLYESLNSDMGEKIRRNIAGDPPHFVLAEGDRCPFLNERGLCEIICEHGDGALCDICYLHPRFRHFYSSFIETGLGLCCEEVARVILSEEKKFSISRPLGARLTREEGSLLKTRKRIFAILQNRKKFVWDRLILLAEKYDLPHPSFCLVERYLGLERLDENWTTALLTLKPEDFDGSVLKSRAWQIPFEQLAVYFVFRHLHATNGEQDYAKVIWLVLCGCFLLAALAAAYERKHGAIGIEQLAEFARMYSAEVEYSEENLEQMMETF